MWAVWLRVRAGLRQDWRGPVVLALVTGLMGAVVLVALAGARRTDTAVSRFLQYAGPIEGEVDHASPRMMDKIAALPNVAYSGRGALMLAVPVTGGGRAASVISQVGTWALIDLPPQVRMIIVAGRRAVSSRASEVMINEAAARILKARVGSVIQLRGYRRDQAGQVQIGTARAVTSVGAVSGASMGNPAGHPRAQGGFAEQADVMAAVAWGALRSGPGTACWRRGRR
jgi:hypothetical protein